MIALHPGFVVAHQIGDLLVIRVNDSGATCIRNGTKHVKYETTGGKKIEFTTHDSRFIHITNEVPADWVIARGVDVSKHSKQQTNNEQENKTMKTNKASKSIKPISNPRGGLAAEIAADKAAQAKPAKPAKAEKKAKAKKAAKAQQAKSPKSDKPSRTAFIDALFVEGGHTKAEIIAKVKAAGYEGTNEELVARCNERPYWIRKAGKVAKWVEAVAVSTDKK